MVMEPYFLSGTHPHPKHASLSNTQVILAVMRVLMPVPELVFSLHSSQKN